MTSEMIDYWLISNFYQDFVFIFFNCSVLGLNLDDVFVFNDFPAVHHCAFNFFLHQKHNYNGTWYIVHCIMPNIICWRKFCCWNALVFLKTIIKPSRSNPNHPKNLVSWQTRQTDTLTDTPLINGNSHTCT